MTQLSRIPRASVEDGSLDVDSEMTVVSGRRVVTKSQVYALGSERYFQQDGGKGALRP